MKREKIIAEIMGTELKKLGFAYENEMYVRSKDGIFQRITICEERFNRNHAKMYFSTTAYGQRQKELGDFVPGILQESWKYQTEDEYRSIIRQFTDWTLAYGLEQLDKMSVPATEERPKPETNRYLYEHHEELNREYLKKMGMEDADAPDVLFALQDEIEKLQKVSFVEAEEALIGLAAVYGHCMCLFGKGTWFWDEEYQVCEVLDMGESETDECPLITIIGFYKQKEISDNALIGEYIDIIYDRNNLIKSGEIEGDLISMKVINDIYEKMHQRKEEK